MVIKLILFVKKQNVWPISRMKNPKGKILLVDIQGGGIELFDPEIASSELFDDNEMLLILC